MQVTDANSPAFRSLIILLCADSACITSYLNKRTCISRGLYFSFADKHWRAKHISMWSSSLMRKLNSIVHTVKWHIQSTSLASWGAANGRVASTVQLSGRAYLHLRNVPSRPDTSVTLRVGLALFIVPTSSLIFRAAASLGSVRTWLALNFCCHGNMKWIQTGGRQDDTFLEQESRRLRWLLELDEVNFSETKKLLLHGPVDDTFYLDH